MISYKQHLDNFGFIWKLIFRKLSAIKVKWIQILVKRKLDKL